MQSQSGKDDHVVFTRSQVLYLYESLAGYGLIILRTVGWCMFIYSNFFTMKHYPEKGGFYYPYFWYVYFFILSAQTFIVKFAASTHFGSSLRQR